MRIQYKKAMQRGLTALMAGLMAAVLACSSGVTAFAEGTGTLTLRPKNGNSYVGTDYNGTFSLYQVATGVEHGKYDLTDAFAAYSGKEISSDTIGDKAAFKEITQDLAAYVSAHKAEITPAQDDLRAFTAYTVPYGLYLVVQKSTGDNYTACTPFLVTVPDFSDGETKTNVTAYPKLSKKTTPGGGGDDEDTPVKMRTGKVALGKLDAVTGEQLEGVVFTLYKADGTPIGTYTTDSEGIIYVDKLPYGSYYFVETKALDGYILDDSHQDFTIDSETQKDVVMTNMPEEVPEESEGEEQIGGFTGDDSQMLVYGGIAVLAIVVLVGWVIWKKRSDQQEEKDSKSAK